MNDDLCIMPTQRGGRETWVVMREAGASDGLVQSFLVLLPLLYAASLLVLLLMPSPVVGVIVPEAVSGDLLHVPAFLLLGLFSAVAYIQRLPLSLPVAALLIWLGVSFFGISTEVMQSFVGRTTSLSDAIVDILSALSGVLLVTAWCMPRRFTIMFGLSGGVACLVAIAIPLA